MQWTLFPFWTENETLLFFLGRCQDITQKISKHLLTNIYIYIYIRKRRFPQLNLDILSQASKFIGGSHDFPSRSWYPHGTPNGYPSNADVTTRHGATNLDRRGFSDEECCDKKCLRPLWTCLPRRSNWCINI
jgi:hypothetical protein